MKRVVIKGDKKLHNDAIRWCINNIGIDSIYLINGNWYCKNISYWEDINTTQEYVFASELDAVEFSLRWA